MVGDKVPRCDCGYRLRARTEQHRVAEVRRHASEAHGVSFSAEEALAVLRRLQFQLDQGGWTRGRNPVPRRKRSPTLPGRIVEATTNEEEAS